jgi:hypothetical protein
MREYLASRSLNSVGADLGVSIGLENRRRRGRPMCLPLLFRDLLIVASFLCLCSFLPAGAEPTVDATNLKNNEIPTQTSPKSGAAETANTVQLICQMTLDLPALEKYFHPTESSRKPLRVIKNDTIKGDLKLTKFNLPVEFVTLTEAKKQKKPYFEFTSIEVKDNTATVSFRYRIEGIRGKVNFKREGVWQVVSHELVEERWIRNSFIN